MFGAATSTAIGTRLVSDKKIEIGVGTKAELRGTEVQAPQIAFVHTDPTKAGELILGGSTNTTQSAHTEKTEYAGLYQEQKGHGQTDQSFNATTLTNSSATILGRQLVNINAGTINNLGGAISGQSVALVADEDINNQGGSIRAQDLLALQAGRDIHSSSNTATASTGDTTGAAQVNAANTSASAITGTGAAPAVALDVSAIGGMYAGKIRLVGTEAGLGVNNAGTIAANITITGTGNKGTDAASQQQVASLTSRDAKTANQSLTNTLTLQQAQAVQEQQKTAQENAQAGQLVGSVAFNVVGDIAQKNGWSDSSPQKVALHAIAGFIQASAAGQNGASGALAAMGNEALTSAVNDAIDSALPMPPNATPEQQREVSLSRKALAESAASLLGATTVALAGGSKQQIGQGGAVALNADRFNRQLHPDERKLASQLAAKSQGKYTAKQIEDAMRNSGNGKLGENITTGMVVNANDPGAIYDTGAQWQKGADGKLVQVLPNNGNVDPALAAFIINNTGEGTSAYSWYDAQLGRSSAAQSAPTSGNTAQRYGQYAANGKIYTLPVADCPAVSCTNDTPIARYGVSAEDAAAIAAYDNAKKKEMAKDAVTGGLVVATAVALPATLAGAATGGAIVGGGSSAANQTIDGQPIDAVEVGSDAVKGAVVGVAGYGVVKGLFVADNALSKVGGQAVADGANGGVAVEPIVTAKGTVNGTVFEDVNQTAKIGTTNDPTLIADRVAAKTEAQGKPFPNGTVADSHAEIGVIQQAYNAGKTQGSGMSMTVSGKDVCGYCKGDIAAAAEAAGLKSLTVQAVDNVTGLPKIYYWQPGMKSIKEKP